MPPSAKTNDERASRVQIAALAALGIALLAAAALGIYQASVARAHAAREVTPEGAPSVGPYLPGASGQIGTLQTPLMVARRAALRDGFDRDEAPIDAFDRLRSIPGHEDEARSLLAEFWDRKAMLADNPLSRVLYTMQGRVVDDDDSRRLTAGLGPRRARTAAKGEARRGGYDPFVRPPRSGRAGLGLGPRFRSRGRDILRSAGEQRQLVSRRRAADGHVGLRLSLIHI